MDPDLSEAHRQWVVERTDILIEGYTTTAEHEHGADYHWICEQCYEDFADQFEWRVEKTS